MTFQESILDPASEEPIPVDHTYILACNIDYLEHKTVPSYYGEYDPDVISKHIIEVKVKHHHFEKIFLLKWDVNGQDSTSGPVHLFDYMVNLPTTVWDIAIQGNLEHWGIRNSAPFIELLMWTQEGDYQWVGVEKKDLPKMIVSVNLVSYHETFINDSKTSTKYYFEPEDQVVFLYPDRVLYEHQKFHAIEFLTICESFTIAETRVHSFHTNLYLREFPGIPFTSTMFVEFNENIRNPF